MMSNETNELLIRVRLNEELAHCRLRVVELERQLLRSDYKRELKRLGKRRREQLDGLAKLDQINAAIRRINDSAKENP